MTILPKSPEDGSYELSPQRLACRLTAFSMPVRGTRPEAAHDPHAALLLLRGGAASDCSLSLGLGAIYSLI